MEQWRGHAGAPVTSVCISLYVVMAMGSRLSLQRMYLAVMKTMENTRETAMRKRKEMNNMGRRTAVTTRAHSGKLRDAAVSQSHTCSLKSTHSYLSIAGELLLKHEGAGGSSKNTAGRSRDAEACS